jgi:hypothetical protein
MQQFTIQTMHGSWTDIDNHGPSDIVGLHKTTGLLSLRPRREEDVPADDVIFIPDIKRFVGKVLSVDDVKHLEDLGLAVRRIEDDAEIAVKGSNLWYSLKCIGATAIAYYLSNMLLRIGRSMQSGEIGMCCFFYRGEPWYVYCVTIPTVALLCVCSCAVAHCRFRARHVVAGLLQGGQ